jgi:hypothetical protein
MQTFSAPFFKLSYGGRNYERYEEFPAVLEVTSITGFEFEPICLSRQDMLNLYDLLGRAIVESTEYEQH